MRIHLAYHKAGHNVQLICLVKKSFPFLYTVLAVGCEIRWKLAYLKTMNQAHCAVTGCNGGYAIISVLCCTATLISPMENFNKSASGGLAIPVLAFCQGPDTLTSLRAKNWKTRLGVCPGELVKVKKIF